MFFETKKNISFVYIYNYGEIDPFFITNMHPFLDCKKIPVQMDRKFSYAVIFVMFFLNLFCFENMFNAIYNCILFERGTK